MLTQSTETAIQVMILIAGSSEARPLTVREIGAALGGSPTYLAKTIRDLVRSGVLRSFRGPSGGVTLAGEPGDVSLLTVVEAVQGLPGDSTCEHPETPCAFHRATAEIHAVLIDVLSRWTLRDLLESPDGIASCRVSPPGNPPDESTRKGNR